VDDIIVRVLRAVACRTRLRILSRLAEGGELTPSQLARALRLNRDLVSVHLARLDAAGLIYRRRSGARCHCAARSPYSQRAFSGALAAWLYDALQAAVARPTAAGRPPHGGGAATDPAPGTHRILFDAATAFTNLRRLQILRRVAGDKAVDGPVLSAELRMSPAAVSRHVAKLVRRGYLRVSHLAHRTVCRGAPEAKTPLHARLLEIVASHWGGEQHCRVE